MPTSTKPLTAGDLRVALATIPDHVPLCIYASLDVVPETTHIDISLKLLNVRIALHAVVLEAGE